MTSSSPLPLTERDLSETGDNRVIIDFIKDICYYSLLQYLYLFCSFCVNLLLYFIDFIQSIYNLNTPS